jgi:arsenate reductase-like glutaredoxin family protein
MFLTLYVYDISIDNKSSRTFNFSLKLSIELSYAQIVKNIQLFSEIISRPIIYTNGQEHSIILIVLDDMCI